MYRKDLYIPPVNIIHDSLGFACSMCDFDVVFDPGNKMIFERPFDDLVKYVRRQKLVDVGAWEVCRVWL